MNLLNNIQCDSINTTSPIASMEFSSLISKYLDAYYQPPYIELVLLCIGTDRSTGDALGPLIGYKISDQLSKYHNVYVYGTLDEPVHAKNLEETIDNIYASFKKPFVIAIDACLGKADRIGYINISKEPLRPGAGVNKKLPSVGDLSITGIVNLSGYMEYMVLQNTRLSLVMKMADTLSSSIKHTLWKFNQQKVFKEN